MSRGIDDTYTGTTLKADDIKGREPTVTIKSWEEQEFTDRTTNKTSKKVVLSFVGAKKTFVVNKTNATRIAYMHGKTYDGWVGKQITLFVDPFVQFGNEIKPAIRVKPPNVAPAPAPAPQTYDELEPEDDPLGSHADMDDEIPF